MKALTNAVFPLSAGNDYRGGRVALYGFCLLTAAHMFKATVHFLAPDSGVNSLASILVFEGTPDPNNLIYMFSAVGGLNQAMWAFMFVIVLARYRNLVPLMLAFMLLEKLFGFVVMWMHPLTPAYFEHTPPGKLSAVPQAVICSVLFFLSIWRTVDADQRDE